MGGDLLWACSYCLLQDGYNAFHLYAEGGHVTLAKYLVPKIERMACLTGSTALHMAAEEGQLPMVEYLIITCNICVQYVCAVC